MIPTHKGLGLNIRPDPQDEKYPVRLPRRAVRRVTKRWAYFAAPLNQGDTGTCVGHAGKHALMAGPVVTARKPTDRPTAIELYILCCGFDEWLENDNGDLQFGTSMNALGKALRSLGLITEWQHGYTVDAAADFLAGVDENGRHVGAPACFGLPWTTGMFDTDSEGFLHPTGRVVGGHAIACFQWNEQRGFFYGPNSWGRGDFGKLHKTYGKDGYWRMSGENMEKLLRMDGEFIAFHELRPAKAIPPPLARAA